ncbi:MAG: hypothetical protein JNK84_14610 [Phreatobacter sp.]|uniref:DUF6165 family protein n=1 Tax=Phreatobacter sp. TaxID=1966341 RepID=UPI001A470BDA|nr:DUF6165 family protein [Phreatobacter sp.]MBL8570298.1 hypothetical protein [Phreatobacter sp.]
MQDSDNIVLMVPASAGELIDKITILRIKSERISDSAKLANVRKELVALEQVLSAHFPAAGADLRASILELQAINERLWTIEDDIRDCERMGDFGASFVALARAVYLTNDERARVKRAINTAVGSAFVEEKSYRDVT